MLTENCVFNKPTNHLSIEILYNDKIQAIFKKFPGCRFTVSEVVRWKICLLVVALKALKWYRLLCYNKVMFLSFLFLLSTTPPGRKPATLHQRQSQDDSDQSRGTERE